MTAVGDANVLPSSHRPSADLLNENVGIEGRCVVLVGALSSL